MRIHCLQHVPFEDAANIALWAQRRGFSLTHSLMGEAPLPAHRDYDFLAIMGGPMNIYEHDRFPWLAEEKAFIRQAIDAGKIILGVCLGAQLISDVLGGPVTRNPHREIGWFPVRRTEAARRSPLAAWPDEVLAFHWHGDTFAIAPGARLLASSDACRHQAFLWGDRVVGLQFHIEYSRDSIERMIAHCSDELQPGPFVQSADELLPSDAMLARTTSLLEAFLDALTQRQPH